jgi:hypothetical protein
MTNLVEIYVGFHPPSRESMATIFGHVEAWGYTDDQTWVFIDPCRARTTVTAVHRHDQVEEMLAYRFAACSEIWRTSKVRDMRLPPLVPLTCIGVVGTMIGCRAFTFRGLRGKLRKIGAEKIHARPKGRSRGQEGTPA